MPRVACVQMDVIFGDPDENVRRIVEFIHELKPQGADFVVFPECCLSGYCVEEKGDLDKIGIGRSSNYLTRIQEAVDETGIIAIFGFAESSGDEFFNTAAMLTPSEPPQFYIKTHLPELGYDRFVVPGKDLPVFETKFGKIGMLICFDVRHPESARALALKGADAIFLPTNWPTGADVSADLLAVARAVENKVYVITCNRIGVEHGFRFIGKSKIIDPKGTILDSADDKEKVLLADLDFEQSRNKRNVTVPGKHETTIFESRRPELYGIINSQTEKSEGKTQ